MTWLIGNCILRSITENMYKMVVKNIPVYLISLNQTLFLKGKTQKIFRNLSICLFYRTKWDIVALILTDDKWEHGRLRMRRIMAETFSVDDKLFYAF